MSDDTREAILAQNKGLAVQALRVLGMAYKVVAELPATIDSDSVEMI